MCLPPFANLITDQVYEEFAILFLMIIDFKDFTLIALLHRDRRNILGENSAALDYRIIIQRAVIGCGVMFLRLLVRAVEDWISNCHV